MSPHTPDLGNGKEMFYAGGCISCHAVPNQPDKTRLGGGFGLRSPFGVFYVPNISSDPTDGIGNWSEAQFITAMVKGTSPAGEHLFPAFPYTSYQRMSFDDLRDLFAYLKTLPAVKGKVRDHDVPFPFNIRRTLGHLEVSFSRRPTSSNRIPPNPRNGIAAPILSTVLATAPSVILRAIFSGPSNQDRRFAGGPSPDGQGGTPNITQQKLKNWTVKDIADTLTTGMTPDADFVGGSMAEVVRNTSQLSAADREAMATYIKSLPPIEGSSSK